MKHETSFISVFFSTFKTFSCLFILVVLPLSFLYYFDSYVLLSKRQLILDTAIMALIFTLLALAAALLGMMFYSLLRLFLRKDTVINILFFYNMLGVAVAVYEFIKMFKLWTSKVFPGDHVRLISDIFTTTLVVILVVLVILFRNKIRLRLEIETNRWFKPVMALFGISLTILIIQIAYTHFIISPKDSTVKIRENNSSVNERPNIILITFDALTAQDMSLYGYKLKTTPNIDSFALESYVFTNMYANANWTRPGVASILTGTYPSTHRLINTGIQNCFLPDELRNMNIAALLKANGYQTAAVVSNWVYAHPSSNHTFHNFDYAPFNTTNDAEFRNRIEPIYLIPESATLFFTKIGSTAHIWCALISNTYLGFLNKILTPGEQQSKLDTVYSGPPEKTFNIASSYLQKAKTPFFLWIHVMVPHGPYLPADGFKKQFLKENSLLTFHEQTFPQYDNNFYPESMQPTMDKLRLRYNEHILWADHAFGEFIHKLKNDGYMDHSTIIISSDHGESFRRGVYQHSSPTLYNDLIRIPLIIRTPKQKHHKLIEQPAAQIDIAPTILDLLDIAVPHRMEGESLKSKMQKNAANDKPIFSMQLDGNRIRGAITKGTVAVIKDHYKYIFYVDKPRSELYNMMKDPEEMTDLAKIEKERAVTMHGLMMKNILKRNDQR